MNRWLRSFGSLAILVGAVAAQAQNPDVRFKLDLILSYRSSRHGPDIARFYDALGHYSTFGLIFYLEPGFRTFFSEKLQRVDNDPDNQSLDEYYIEDEGIWRIGKQYLPFGRGLVRESVTAIRGDSNLIVEGVPIAVAYCDAGEGRQRGVVGRIGSTFGLSFAIGEHFGINSTALTLVRRIEDSPGVGSGWKNMIGMDYSVKHGLWTYTGEFVSLLDPEAANVRESIVADVNVTYFQNKKTTLGAGLSRDFSSNSAFTRVFGSFSLVKGLVLEPIVRFRNLGIYDLSIGLRFKF